MKSDERAAEEWWSSEEFAYTRCRDSLSLTQGAGGKAGLAGQRISIYRKQPDNRWVLARDARTFPPEMN